MIAVSLFFLWTIFDRLRRTFKEEAFKTAGVSLKEKSNSILMIIAYVGIAVDGFIFFFMNRQRLSLLSMIAGACLYLTARYLRNAAIRSLGAQWNVYISAKPISRIVKLGPFKYSRHPYYIATIFELIAYGLLFASLRTVLFAVLIFFPLMVLRIKLEERNLIEKFQGTYEDYKREVWWFFSIPKFLADIGPMQDLPQIVSIVRRFGFHQLHKIRFMSDSVVRYSRGYAISRISGAMIEIGMIEELLDKGHVDILKFGRENNFDVETLKILSDYFSVVGIFDKSHFDYRLTSYGKELFDVSRGIFTLLYAYMPVFEALPAIIHKDKKYGVDIFRKSDFVGKGSNELAELLPFPYARDILKRHKVNKILDIGCGAGEFLINSCRDNGFYGYGVDISPEVIAIASQNAQAKGVDSKAKFAVGDLCAVHELHKEFKKVDALVLMFVLHEFLKDSDRKVVTILSQIRENFPKSFILICEIVRWNIQKLTEHPISLAEHHLFHNLSKQGLANIEQWRSIFREAGFICAEERRFDRAGQAYFLLKANLNT